MFDWVMPIRNVRSSHLFARFGDLMLRYERFKDDQAPIDMSCTCHACKGWEPTPGQLSGGFSRAYLHHLERCGEMLAPMLASIHNLHYYLNLMQEIRDALDQGRFEAWRLQFKADRARGV